MRLATKDQWEKSWSKVDITELDFDPHHADFRERHRLFRKYIPKSSNGTAIEIGVYPGKYIAYFHKYFDYAPWGIEYVNSCASRASKLLEKNGIPATILNKDFFDLDPRESPTKDGWDVTVSFGFIEHFDDSSNAIAKHIEVTRPSGIIAISIPNHSGINGWILRKIDRPLWDQHNKMSLEDMEAAVQKVGGCEVLFSGYVGRMGFAPSKLWPTVRARFGSAFPLFRAPVWFMERLAQRLLPNNRWTSPHAIMILRKDKVFHHECDQ